MYERIYKFVACDLSCLWFAMSMICSVYDLSCLWFVDKHFVMWIKYFVSLSDKLVILVYNEALLKLIMNN